MITDIFDLYSDFLITNLGQHTSTSLSAVLDKCVSHDQITRALSKPAYGSAQLWQYVKPMVNAMKSLGESGVLCLDDTLEARPVKFYDFEGNLYNSHEIKFGLISLGLSSLKWWVSMLSTMVLKTALLTAFWWIVVWLLSLRFILNFHQ